MARLRCDFFSDVLQVATTMTVILPQEATNQIGAEAHARAGNFPVLYLLHGLSDDDSAWTRQTSIERYAMPLGLAVVMPQVSRSFYRDEATGNRYRTFLTEELPSVVRDFFRVSQRPEDTFVAGLSMGGYGALTWALTHPDHFAAAASLSGALDVATRSESPNDITGVEFWDRVFGGRPVRGTSHDPMWLVEQAATSGAAPPSLYVACGTEDDCFPDNERFVAACQRHHLPVTVDFGPGEHEWGYWDARIRDVLAWLPLERGDPA